VALDPGLEAVLAWAVREGATNVIRHSGASRCSVRVVVGLAEASVEVADDGGGAVGGGASLPGHGLAGLRERAEALGGRVEAGPSAGGGFRLCVRVPVAAGPVDGGAGPADGAAGGLSSAAAAGAGAAPAVGS
jgi:two-component system sensor histidine kinase DesK